MIKISTKREERLRELISYFRNSTNFLGEFNPAADYSRAAMYKSNVLEFQILVRPLFAKGSEVRQGLENLTVDPKNYETLFACQSALNFLMQDVEEALDSTGGILLKIPSESLKQVLQKKNIPPVEKELKRCMDNVESDPAAAITSASSIVESVCKVYIEEYGLVMPNNQSIRPLWKTLSSHIGLGPSSTEANDVNMVLSGLKSVVEGVGNLRTHAGSAHGRGLNGYDVQPRHARLAVHSAQTLLVFLLETWETRNPKY